MPGLATERTVISCGGIIKTSNMKRIFIMIFFVFYSICFIFAPVLAQEQNTKQQPPNEMQIIIELIQTLFGLGGDISYSPDASAPGQIDPFITPPFPVSSIIPTVQNGYVYYHQCDPRFGDTALPQGCTICSRGCGLTTVAIVLSSFKDRSMNPFVVNQLYAQNGLYAGCEGTSITSAKIILNQYGLRTTDYFVYQDTPALTEEIAPLFENYVNAGWTIVALSIFSAGNRHFFWITNVDENNNIWALDPYYGKDQIPFNESRYYPYPKYFYAFGVRI